ncbi:hypothetical protein ACOT81_14500 [Streptomyces sp. WI04-05B]|uniref:hypothetical protein n=1 Tax=Streptomyces TaxID=1883 RepID=UPI0029A2C3CF|nr:MULTISPECIES: hypothetical protein [unclassified Streptomyces]MDX2540407.1 hypothetical protein [Streptomyces sp. WI04-05B]MDX2585160.1 hypothetical protein [Streptomyces sp. WI04-05A]
MRETDRVCVWEIRLAPGEPPAGRGAPKSAAMPSTNPALDTLLGEESNRVGGFREFPAQAPREPDPHPGRLRTLPAVAADVSA